MAQPTHPLLQQIYNLKPDSPDFRDQLNTVLHGHGYEECRKVLGKDDVAWFVNYLDEVRCCVALPRSPLKPAL